MPTDLQLVVARLNIVEEENQELKEKMKKTEEEKMLLELSVADTVHVHKIKMDTNRLKLRKMRRYAIDKEAWFHYALGSDVTLVAIFIAVVILFRCTR